MTLAYNPGSNDVRSKAKMPPIFDMEGTAKIAWNKSLNPSGSCKSQLCHDSHDMTLHLEHKLIACIFLSLGISNFLMSCFVFTFTTNNVHRAGSCPILSQDLHTSRALIRSLCGSSLRIFLSISSGSLLMSGQYLAPSNILGPMMQVFCRSESSKY